MTAMTDPTTLRDLAAHQDAPAVRQALEDAAQRIEALEAALGSALDHIDHMAAFIGKRKLGYSFESFGEDIDDIRLAAKDAKTKENSNE